MQSLFAATNNETAEYAESLEYVYDVGEKGEKRDIVTRRFTLKPVSNVLTWKRMKFGSRGEVDLPTSFYDLQPTAMDSKGTCRLLPVDETNKNNIDAVVFFEPPIRTGETRTLTVSYVWRGLWNPLRANGQDAGTIRALHQRIEEIRIKVRFPAGTTGARWDQVPKGATTTHGEEGGRSYLEWSLDNPQPGEHHFSVKATIPD